MINNIRQSQTQTLPSYQWLKEQEYTSFLKKMQVYAQQLSQADNKEVVWFCTHQNVYTTGKRGINNSLGNLDAPLQLTDRGGETTFHGVGQLMMYPIINLKTHHLSVRNYVQLLEESCLQLLAHHNIQAMRDCGFPGVWINNEKIAALGIRVSQGIASHGIALNVNTDLAWFERINPCGTSRKMTNMVEQDVKILDLENLAQQWFQIFIALLKT